MSAPHETDLEVLEPELETDDDLAVDSDEEFDESDISDTETEIDDLTEIPHSPKSKNTRDTSRTQLRRVASKAIEIHKASARERELCAHLLGLASNAEAVTITATIYGNSHAAATPLNDAKAIAEADPMEAGIIAGMLDRSRLKAVWTLLGILDVPGSGTNLPPSDAKASLMVAKKIVSVKAETWATVDKALALTRKV